MTCLCCCQRAIRYWLACAVLGLFLLEGPAHAQDVTFTATELLGRPSADSITVGVIVDQPVELYVEFGVQAGDYLGASAASTFGAGPIEVVLDGLSPDTQYYYRLRYRAASSDDDWFAGDEHSFHTQRSPSSTFTFTIQTDSHQGYFGFYDGNLYATTLANELADNPDFLVDLGDAFSLDDYAENETSVRTKYLNQRDYFGRVGHSVPLFLALGNHENEEGWNLDDFGAEFEKSLPVLGTNARKRYFINPVPNGFYTGNDDNEIEQIDGDHLREDYYAFEWGAALFVVIDPYWYTMVKPYFGGMGGEKDDEVVVGDRWSWTLGERQYHWLKHTLEESAATFKFIFAHHLTGGTDDYSRAGVAAARFCEWGGFNLDGTWGFDAERADWELPIHSLMVENDVTAFFHGHDHVFAYEQLDGIVYQECPHAANRDYGTGFYSNLKDYAGGVMVNNSGHVRVTVSPSDVQVDYVRAYLPGDGTNGSIGYSYNIEPHPHNARPEANDDAVVTNENTPIAVDVLANDTDPNPKDTLSVVGVTQPNHGRVTLDATQVVYQPNRDYCDETTPDQFRYVASDGRGGIDRAYVSVTVHCVNKPPVAADDAVSGNPAEYLTINAAANDSDPDSNLLPSSVSIVRSPAHGNAVENGDGSVSYQSNAAFTGSDSLDYQICDDAGLCDVATVRITTKCTNSTQCDDRNGCSDDTCDTSGACTHATSLCSDDNACTVDACSESTGCTHVAVICNDGNACTDDACDPATGCSHAALDCNDGSGCTVDACDPATGCSHTALDCNDGKVCTFDACSPTTGCTHATLNCNDDNACTVDACSETSGCTHIAVSCNDDNACTVDTCSPATGCSHVALDCNDNDACTVEACDPVTGCSHSVLNCSDDDACTVDACSKATGCTHTGLDCNDDNACTVDACSATTGCSHAALDCDDADPCTVDSCGPTGCQHVPMACDDGNACTNDTCSAGACVHHEVDCGGDKCHPMTCNPSNGQCQGHGIDCDDGNPCTNDTCDGAIGCVHVNNNVACDDGKNCTFNDHCVAGQCQGSWLNCSSLGNECAIGTCNESALLGCVLQPLSDGTSCSKGICQQGQCVPVLPQGSGGAGASTIGGGTSVGGAAPNSGGGNPGGFSAQAGQGTGGGNSTTTGGTAQATTGGSNTVTGGATQDTGSGGTRSVPRTSQPIATSTGGSSNAGIAGNTSTSVSSGGNQGTDAEIAGQSTVGTKVELGGQSVSGSGCSCSTLQRHSSSAYISLLVAGIAVGLRRRTQRNGRRRR